MHIGIDCKPLQEGPAGVQTYLRNLVRELASIPEIRVTCFYSTAFKAPELPAGGDVKAVKGPWINNWVWTEWQLPRAVHASNAPGGCRVPGVGGQGSGIGYRVSEVGGSGVGTEDSEQGRSEGLDRAAADTRPVTSKQSSNLTPDPQSTNPQPPTRHPTPDTGHLTPDTRHPTPHSQYPIDIFHFPAYTASSRLNCSKVVSIHDVSYAAHPDWYPHAGGKIRQRFYRRSAECADAVITISEFSKREIARVYSIAPERIFSIYLASGLEDVKAAARWDRPQRLQWYLLHVGDLHARRNLLTALDAFKMVALDRDLDFVFIGRDLGARAEIQQHAKNLGCQNRLHFLQDLPLDQMPHWYRNAALMVYPSLYEGFGLPLLEAMQCGCPVVASRAACIPEITGDAAWLVDPLNAREIADGIRTILAQPETRELLVKKGLQRARQFSWKKTADETVAVYRQVLQRKDAKTQSRKDNS